MLLRDAGEPNSPRIRVTGYQFPDAPDPAERYSWHLIGGEAAAGCRSRCETVGHLAGGESLELFPCQDDQFMRDRNRCSVTVLSTVMSLPPVITTPAAVTLRIDCMQVIGVQRADSVAHDWQQERVVWLIYLKSYVAADISATGLDPRSARRRRSRLGAPTTSGRPHDTRSRGRLPRRGWRTRRSGMYAMPCSAPSLFAPGPCDDDAPPAKWTAAAADSTGQSVASLRLASRRLRRTRREWQWAATYQQLFSHSSRKPQVCQSSALWTNRRVPLSRLEAIRSPFE